MGPPGGPRGIRGVRAEAPSGLQGSMGAPSPALRVPPKSPGGSLVGGVPMRGVRAAAPLGERPGAGHHVFRLRPANTQNSRLRYWVGQGL